MKRKYYVVKSSSKGAAKTIQNFCQANGQMLLPLVDLISEARVAVDEIIDQAGRSWIETILTVSAEQVAGEKTLAKASGEVRWHGRQKGSVRLADRQLRVERPRLRRKSGGEVAVPAYQALREGEQTGAEMFEALLKGVSTRNYREVIPRMADSVGVSRSAVSREAAARRAGCWVGIKARSATSTWTTTSTNSSSVSTAAAHAAAASSSIASFSRRRRSKLPLAARSLPTGTPKRREAGHKMLGHLNEVDTPLRLKMNSTRRRNLQLSLGHALPGVVKVSCKHHTQFTHFP